MPKWIRLVLAGLLVPVAAVALVPLGYAAYRLKTAGPGTDTRLGVRVEPPGDGTLTAEERADVLAVFDERLRASDFDAARVEPGETPDETVAVTLSPSTDPARAKRLLRIQGKLELRPVVGDSRVYQYATPREAESAPGFDPSVDEVLPYDERGPAAAGAAPRYLAVEKPVVTSEDLRTAEARADDYERNNSQIDFTLHPAGASKFGAWTEANVGRDVAVVVDGRILSAPRIQSKITDRGQITGKFSREDAEDLAIAMRSARLPGEVTFASERPLATNGVRTKYGIAAAVAAAVLLASLVGIALLVRSAVRGG